MSQLGQIRNTSLVASQLFLLFLESSGENLASSPKSFFYFKKFESVVLVPNTNEKDEEFAYVAVSLTNCVYPDDPVEHEGEILEGLEEMFERKEERRAQPIIEETISMYVGTEEYLKIVNLCSFVILTRMQIPC